MREGTKGYLLFSVFYDPKRTQDGKIFLELLMIEKNVTRGRSKIKMDVSKKFNVSKTFEFIKKL